MPSVRQDQLTDYFAVAARADAEDGPPLPIELEEALLNLVPVRVQPVLRKPPGNKKSAKSIPYVPPKQTKTRQIVRALTADDAIDEQEETRLLHVYSHYKDSESYL